MKVGMLLPQFRAEGATALAAARRAEDAGLDGIFVFDHLWPIGQPDRPALRALPLLAAAAAVTECISVGTLVARIGLVPDAILAHELETLDRIAPRRVIAGLGTGDNLSKAENLAYGIPFAPAEERLESMAGVARRLRDAGIEVWVGGLSSAVRDVALDVRVALNLWGSDAGAVAGAVAAGAVEVTWAGQVVLDATERAAHDRFERLGLGDEVVHGDVAAVTRQLASRRDAGATWAVCALLGVADDLASVDLLGEVRRELRAG